MSRFLSKALSVRVLVVVALVVVGLPIIPAATAVTPPAAREIAERLGKLIKLDAARRPAEAKIRVAVISSGVDAASLPKVLDQQISGARWDGIGYGTYAASVVFQLAPQAQITSMNVYGGKDIVPDSLLAALNWTSANAKAFDAVLFAFPPNDYLDPITAAMAAGSWETITSALGRARLDGKRGPVFGLPMDAGLMWKATKDASPADRDVLYKFRSAVQTWNSIRDDIAALTRSDVGVVAPAGDVGPHLQTIHGVASLPDVETVGGFNSGRPSALSASGPSIDGRVKPDVLAPTGIVGLIPQNATLSKELAHRRLLDASLEPAWSFGSPPTLARTRLDTTVASAAYVAAAMAGMSAGGEHDVTRQRAALTAASVPFDGVAVWRQGAGELRFVPDARFASSRPLVAGNGDLGAQPDSGVWSTAVRVLGARASDAHAHITDFAGVEPNGATSTRSVASGPPVSAHVTKDGVTLDLPLGDGSYSGGLYCGYTAVSVPGTGDDADPRAKANGIPAGTEQVPTCLVEGTRLRAFGFYIHDLPAENLTFGLLPAMPVGSSLLDKPLALLPVNPLATKLFFKVTNKDGNAYFSNIPPGFYTIRQWSDYGSPVTQTVANSHSGLPIKTDTDLGEEVGYQSFQALVLTPLCTDQVSNAAGEDLCTSAALEKRFGSDNVTFDPTTWTYLVTVAPGVQERVVFNKLKKMPGTAVSSRYIDLLAYKDFTFLTSALPVGVDPKTLDGLAGRSLLQSWSFGQGSRPDSISGIYNPILGLSGIGGGQVGVAWYPFNLTTPNYKAHMSLDFDYTLRNATILVAVQMGNDVGTGAVTPVGELKVPDTNITSGQQVFGSSGGRAHFDFHLLPKGASTGKLWLILVPPVNSALATADIGNVSFELDTWTNDVWPPITFPGPAALIGTNPLKPGVVAGHSFVVDPNYSRRQMSHAGCRLVDQGGQRANVCEDWEVMVHSPGDDAATYDVMDAASHASVRPQLIAGRAGFFDPHRGVHDFTQVLAFDLPSAPALEASVHLTNAFRTNGRFWEQLVLSKSFLAGHNGAVQFRIVDNVPGRRSMLLGVPHAAGGVPVAPYVPYAPTASFLDM